MSATITDIPASSPPPKAKEPVVPEATNNLTARLLAASTLALAMLAGFASLSGVVQGAAWLQALIWPVFLIHFCAGLLRGVHRVRWLALPVAVLIAGGAVFLHPTMRTTIPGLGIFDWFGAVLSEGTLQFSTQVPPVAYSRYVEFVLLLLAVLLSVMVEVLATFRRLAPLVLLPISFAPVIASLFKQEGAGIGYVVLLILALLGYFALLPYIFPAKGTGPGLPSKRQLNILLLTAMVCALVMVLSSAFMPGFRKGMLPEGTRPSGDLLASNVDPLLNLGRDLRANNGSVAFSYLTTSNEPVYLRTSVIEDLSATRWEPDEGLLKSAYFGDTAMDTDSDVFNGSAQVTQLRWNDRVSSPSLPIPDRSFFISGINGPWNWTKETSVARLGGDALTNTEEVTVGHTQMNLSPQIARSLGYYGDGMQSEIDDVYLSMPEDLDGQFGQLLQRTLAEAYEPLQGPPTNDFDIAVAIQDFLRSATFGYSERTPLREGYDGANRQVVKAFLERRQGYCVHFASTMALLARAAGIPSRIVVGYAPGEPTGETLEAGDLPGFAGNGLPADTELTKFEVTGQQAHAWPELFLPGIGWVPFEPTPGQGQAPDYAPEPTSSQPPAEVPEEQNPTGAPTVDDPETQESPGANVEEPMADTAQDFGWFIFAGLLIIALILAAIPWQRTRLRHRRIDRVRAGGQSAAQALWDELCAVGADTGTPATEHESVGDYTRRLSSTHPQHGQQLQLLRSVIEASFYAQRHPDPEDTPAFVEALAQVRTQLHHELPLGKRMLGFCFPASLRQRRLRQVASAQTVR